MISRDNDNRDRHRDDRARHDYRGRRDHRDVVYTEKPGSLVRPYGDKLGDGVVQLSFTLPMPADDKARVAAIMVVEKMGLKEARVLHMESMGENFTFFVVYAVCETDIDVTSLVVPQLDYPHMGFDEINAKLKAHLGRKLVVLGACIGADAHTVGIDAIFNMKGYLGDYGLERYQSMNALNLRAQVDPEQLVKQIVDLQADAVLVSRIVTQRDEHVPDLKKLLELLAAEPKVPGHLIKICGGPRINHNDAVTWGYDAGFGQGTKPSQVASYLTTEIMKRV